MAQEFNGIMKANEDADECVTNDQDMKYEKQGQPLPQSSVSDRRGDRWTLPSMRSVPFSSEEGR